MRRDVVASISFDEALRYGEDVDLIWRLHDAGWRIRYDPSVEVRHDEPATWGELLARRHRYGTSAAPLAIRHPQYISPAVLSLRLSRRAIAADTMAVTRYLSQFVAPLAILGAAPALRQWRIRRPPLHPAGFVAARLADDLAYGAGVWRGAIRHRTLIPLLPTLHRMKERANG
jgi:GT2 family glycosyltransferase